MNNEYTDIVVLLDKSASMERLTTDTIGGFNKFLKDQQKLKGLCRLTLIQFASSAMTVYTAKNVKDVALLNEETYQADGDSTALVDSACNAIDTAGQRYAAMSENDRPGKVIFVLITDGLENSSRIFNKATLKQKIEHQEGVYNWQFIYMGANQDAIKEAAGYGISAGKSLTYAFTSKGMGASYGSLSDTVGRMRCCARAEDTKSINFTEADRAAQNEELTKGSHSRAVGKRV